MQDATSDESAKMSFDRWVSEYGAAFTEPFSRRRSKKVSS